MIQLPSFRLHVPKKKLRSIGKTGFWFVTGAFIGLFFFSSFVYLYYKHAYENKIYPGVIINNVDFGGKSKNEVKNYFAQQNRLIRNKEIQFTSPQFTATVSAGWLNLGYDSNLLASQAYSIGRSGSFFSDIYFSFESYLHGIILSPAYTYSSSQLDRIVKNFQATINIAPVDAKFTYENGRVTQFQTSQDGQEVSTEDIYTFLQTAAVTKLFKNDQSLLAFSVPILTLKPNVKNVANTFGIKERIGVGTSLFHGSIAARIYNIELAASRLNGILVKPGEIFSFDQAVGDISSLSGYKQAYVIQNGHTVLGDGGGVCQVSTTFFRAVLAAGMPVIERHAHAYRVHYYEEDSGPGIDAAIYSPTVDFKFRNDSGHYILIQSHVDEAAQQLTFEFYGTSDGRVATISQPVVLSQTPAPDPLYQDDPDLPVGQIQQVDFAAAGANVYFNYSVVKNGKQIIFERFDSHYQPWQAVYLKGTKT